jgi:hypothetical protein
LSTGAAGINEASSYAAASVGPCARYDSKADQFLLNIGTKGANAPATDILIGEVTGPDDSRVTFHQVLVGLR